jgi:hypothetical protein
MATVAQAAEAISKATGIPLVTVERAARTLREANDSLWPKGKKGGGKGAALVWSHHLVNLLLALMAADPLNEAPEIVEQYRDLEPDGVTQWIEAQSGDTTTTVSAHRDIRYNALAALADEDVLPGAIWCGRNLGQAMEYLVGLAHSPKYQKAMRISAISLTIHRNAPQAVLTFRRCDGENASQHYGKPRRQGNLLDLLPEQNPDSQPVAPITVMASIPFKVFEVLADLDLDTKRVYGMDLFLEEGEVSNPAGPIAEQDAENATPTTGGAGPARVVVSQLGANPVNSRTYTSLEYGDEERENQPPSPSESPGSPRIDGSADHSNRESEPPWPNSVLPMLSVV